MNFSYMGTKRVITPFVYEITKCCKPGPFLDLFCGIGSIGRAFADVRPIWCNDVQHFAVMMAKCNFTSSTSPIPDEFHKVFNGYFYENRAKLLKVWSKWIEFEQKAIETKSIDMLHQITVEMPSILTLPSIEAQPRNTYNLFTTYYSGTYFSINQCIDLDSAIFAIHSLEERNSLTSEQKQWLLLALCKSASSCSTTTGHFAQFLTPKQNNLSYFLKKRRKLVHDELFSNFQSCQACGSKEWRMSNQVFHMDAVLLLRQLKQDGKLPAVVYADPPYTDEQYSRYYHIYETLILYDYPGISSKARYRDKRYRSPFSVKSEAKESIENLICESSELGSDFIMSYPQNGLLGDSIKVLSELIMRSYRSLDIEQITHSHSSFGSANTRSKSETTELLFIGRH